MDQVKVTKLLLLALLLVTILYDVVVWRLVGPQATITGVVRQAAREVDSFGIVAAFLTGVLFAHLFLQ